MLTNPAAVIAGSLAAFALAFGGLTARLVSGHDPAVGIVAAVPRAGSAAGILTTRTSAAAATGAGASSPGARGTAARALKTSTSAAAATSGGGASTVLSSDDGA